VTSKVGHFVGVAVFNSEFAPADGVVYCFGICLVVAGVAVVASDGVVIFLAFVFCVGVFGGCCVALAIA
jgi:hypothetical protein